MIPFWSYILLNGSHQYGGTFSFVPLMFSWTSGCHVKKQTNIPVDFCLKLVSLLNFRDRSAVDYYKVFDFLVNALMLETCNDSTVKQETC